ncbi:MAG: DegT/DnrJ/EryC1/StrS family aminotransferase [Chloroflexota bacterium]|nr:DegT/DnrJ/EryC1/StrS family aminotransferase [Chloroflexota bacterium]
MNIPLVDLKRQHQPIQEAVSEAFESILSSMQLFLGPNTRAFEQEYAEYLDVKEAIGVSEGTTALYLALRACGIGPGDEVVTVSHTFFATVEAITMTGATPVFVDVDPATCLMDVAAAEAAITSRTRALLPVHLYGYIADMDGLMALARRYNLRVIEDACQAHGARRNGRAAGTFGDAGCFSFYYSKNLGAYGEAGGVVTNDPELAARVRLLRDHGSAVRYHHDQLGMNGRLDEMQAAVLRLKLPSLDAGNRARRDHALRYNAGLRDVDVAVPALTGEDHVFHLYVIRTLARDEMRAYLNGRGVGTGIHYPVPCHLQPACAPFVGESGGLPVTERLAGEILSLPMFPELRDEEIDYTVNVIREFFAQRSSKKTIAAQ